MRIFRIFLFLIVVIIFFEPFNDLLAQEQNSKKYDVLKDTLVVINGITIDSERILMSRKEFFEADTFRINQKDIVITGYSMTASTLGNTIELTTSEPILSEEMKDEIINKQSNFKFIYLKNINLQTKDGRVVNPSLNTIKIIFSN